MHYWSPFRAHAEWMAELREFIYGNGDMESERVARDDQCELGEWLYGEGMRYRHFEEYDNARQIHAALHRQAARVVDLVRIGKRTEAAAHVAPGGKLRKMSAALVKAFTRLNRRIVPARRMGEGGERSTASNSLSGPPLTSTTR
jgi:methyl-accepting chemotaxis protein